MVCCFASLGLVPSTQDLLMLKMRQTNEHQASLDFASALEEAGNSSKGDEYAQTLISRGPLT